MHTLDILIPHYKDPDGLALSLQSITAQDWRGTRRVIVVDDGSGPEVLGQVKTILRDCGSDCLLIAHPVNRGRPAARNTALAAVTAPYMAWLDAGDTWYPHKIGTQLRLIRNMEDAGEDVSNLWVSCHFDWVENNRSRFVRQEIKPDMFRELIVGSGFRAYLWTLLGRTEAFRAVGRFDENLPRMQDLDYFLRFVQIGGRFAVPRKREGLCCYYKSDVGRNHRDVARSAQLIFDKFRPVIEAEGLGGRMRWKNAELASRFAYNNRQRLAIPGYFWQAFRYDPKYVLYKVKNRLFA